MKLKKIICALFFIVTFPAVAADKGTLTIPTTAVTGNPLGVGSDQMVVPISILNGRELSLKRENTLAETLNSIPGVSNSSFGPSVGRPMIRGMDSDRVKILQNGVNNLDASNLSSDHGVSIDPLIIEQIDVIRGPATLLYGGGAVGGVVNAIDHRIPKEKLQGITGRGEVRYGGANLEQSNAAVVDVGTGNFVMHFDAYSRDSKNLRIPGNAISNRLESTNYWTPSAGTSSGTGADEDNLKIFPGGYERYSTNHGRKKLLNSQSETRGGAVGASMIFDRGYAGISYAKHQTKYGSVKEPGILLDMDTDRIDFASEIRDLGSFFERAKFRAAYTDYRHHEMGGGEIHSTFKNKGIDGTFELAHAPLMGLKGILGTQFDNGKFDAIGHEAFLPNSKTTSQSIYVYEELPLSQHKMTFGLRRGNHEVESKGGGEEGQFGNPSRKKFNTNNAAIGGLYALNEQWSLTGNLSHNERAPSYFELFANGVHTATGTYQEGQSDLKKEKSNGLDGQIRWKSGQDSLTVGAYFNKFSNFIGLLSTDSAGLAHNEEEINSEITYKKSTFSGIKAEFKGVELEGKTMLTDYVQFNVRGDYVDAKDKTNGGYVPRISPLKLGAGLKYEFDRFGARLDVLHAFKQDRVASNYNYQGGKELMTDAYTNVSMMATYKLPTQLNLEAFTRANNLLDEEIREHTSFLKDIAPMSGRSIMFGLRGEF
jgi:iron complex outermembrane recepter protein